MNWIFNSLPEWIWLAIIVAGVVAVQLTFGWKAALASIAGLGLWFMRSKAYQQGRDDYKQENEQDAWRQIQEGNDSRAGVRDDARSGKLRDDDGYKRD